MEVIITQSLTDLIFHESQNMKEESKLAGEGDEEEEHTHCTEMLDRSFDKRKRC